VIVGVAGRNVTNVAQLLSAVAALQPGTPATLDVVRKDGKSSVGITPGKRTPPPRQVE
jgi:S1-C subfamily serine protease